jgi:hypothetical protein
MTIKDFGKHQWRSLYLLIALTWSGVSAAYSGQHWRDHITISGSPASSVTAGQSYSFTPTATDSQGRALVFAIANKPAWATFSASSGQLTGTPPSGSVGTYANIVIAVSDGFRNATLPAFSVQVLAGTTGPSPSPPAISGTPATSVTAGAAYSFTPTASDPAGNTLTFTIANPPSWAVFNSATGQLSGTPAATNVGTYAGIVISTSDGSSSASLPSFAITVNAATVNPTVSLNGSPGTVSNGSASMLSWSSTNASSCTASGGWSGSKGTSGSWSTGALSATTSYALTCNGSSGTTAATQSTTVTVQSSTAGGSLSVTSPATLPAATSGGSYFYLLQASGGTPPYSWSLSSKSGATNWAVTPDGWLEGAPPANESDSIVATVTDSASNTAQGTFAVPVNSNLAVMGQNFVKGGVSLPAAMAGAAYRHILQAAGGTSPYSWSIASGSLPAGLSLSSAGVITGTPSASGNVGVVLSVTDNTNATATANASITVAAASTVARPAYNTGSGFFVYNGQLYDPNGNLFRIRGVNQSHFDENSSQVMLKAQPNTVRYGMWKILTGTYPQASDYESGAYTQHIANGQFTIIGDFVSTPADGNVGTTGSTDATLLADVVQWWVSNESTFAPIMNQMALNIANEWGPANSSAWAAAYQTAIAQLRAAGYTCPLVIDTGKWGEDFGDLLNYSTQVFNSDPQRNVIFSLHIYANAANALSQNILPQLASLSASQGMAFIVGEFGPGRNIGPAPTMVSPAEIIQASETSGLGWIAWAWDDNDLANCVADNNWFSMTYNCKVYNTPADLTQYGLDVSLNPVYGLSALETPAPVFLN